MVLESQKEMMINISDGFLAQMHQDSDGCSPLMSSLAVQELRDPR